MGSPFDDIPHAFKCENPQCRQVFRKTYGWLLKTNEVVCPTCGEVMDIRESKRTGELGSWLNTVAELAKKRGEKQ